MRSHEEVHGRRVALLATVLWLGGCAVEVAELDEMGDGAPYDVGVTSDALLGSVEIRDCEDWQADTVRNALAIGRAVASTPEYADCLRSHTYEPWSGDPSEGVEGAIHMSNSPNDVDVECDSLGGSLGRTWFFDMHDYGHDDDEAFELDTDFLDVAGAESPRALGAARVAGTIWHEVMHTHGYDHVGSCDSSDTACLDRRNRTMPYIVGYCMREVITGSYSYGGTNLGEDVASRYLRRYRPAIASDAERASMHAGLMSGRWSVGELEAYAVGATRYDVDTSLGMEGWNVRGTSVASGDLDGDGIGDLVIASADINDGYDYLRLRVGRNCAFGSCLWSPTQIVGFAADIAGSPMVTLADFDGDGRSEVAVGMLDNWDIGNDYLRYRVGSCVTGTCAFGDEQYVNLHGAELVGGAMRFADLDGSGRPEMIVSATDHWSGLDYWRYRISTDCDLAGNCSFEYSPIHVLTTGADDVADGDMAAGDLDGNGTMELVLGVVDAWSGTDYVRYTIGSGCTRWGGCSFPPVVGTATMDGAVLGELSISVANLSSAPGYDGSEILLGSSDRWEASYDYWRMRALGQCNVATGVCHQGDIHTLRSNGDTLTGGAVVVADLGPIYPWSPELFFVGVDGSGDADYLRFTSLEFGDRHARSRYLFGTFRSDTGGSSSARDVRVPTTHYEAIETSGDEDWLRFRLDRSATIDLTVTFRHAVGDIDIALIGSDGSTTLATSQGTSDEERIVQGLSAGTYYVRIYGYRGARGGYTMELTEAVPWLPGGFGGAGGFGGI